MSKRYFVESELCPRFQFDNESDRNEMALSLWQEQIYFLTVRTINWYENGILTGVEEDASSNVYTYECETWYNAPTQVAFFNEDCYVAGIGYCDEIICACCGGVMVIDEIIEFAPKGVIPIVEYKGWVDFNKEIIHNKEAIFEWRE